MPLPDVTRKMVEKKLGKFCEERIPPHVRSEIRLGYHFRANTVTLWEERPPFRGLDLDEWSRMTIAQFRFNPKDMRWTLFFSDRNSRWREYHDLEPDRDFGVLLREVEDDPTCIFWG